MKYQLRSLTPQQMDSEENMKYDEVGGPYIEASTDSRKPTTRTQEKEGFLVREIIN